MRQGSGASNNLDSSAVGQPLRQAPRGGHNNNDLGLVVNHDDVELSRDFIAHHQQQFNYEREEESSAASLLEEYEDGRGRGVAGIGVLNGNNMMMMGDDQSNEGDRGERIGGAASGVDVADSDL